MKVSNAILCVLLAKSASAFAPSRSASMPCSTTLSAVANIDTEAPSTKSLEKELSSIEEEIEKQQSMQMQQSQEVEESFVEEAAAPAVDRIQPGRYLCKPESIAVPFLQRPTALDGTHAGDVGFDPLGLTETNDLYVMMEAELRHARLAMLAVIGWPLSEMLGPDWMLKGSNHLAPSVLNGFGNPVAFLTTAAIFGAFGFFEYKTSLRRVNDKALGIKHAEDMADIWEYGVPGDYNFDPLNLYSMFGDDAAGRKGVRELEIAHGRAAMVGITSFAAWEALTGHAIVENSMFFHPNLLLPVLGAAYLSFGFFFEIENDERKVLQVRTTSEGEMRLNRLQNGIRSVTRDNESTIEEAKKIATVLVAGAGDLGGKYEKFVEDYTKSKMQYVDDA